MLPESLRYMDLVLSNIISGVKVYVWLNYGIRHIMVLGYQRICTSFPHNLFAHQKYTRVHSYIIVTMIRIFLRNFIWRKTYQVDISTNLWRGFTYIINKRTTFQLVKLFSLTREESMSRHYRGLYVLLTRLTITPLLKNSYSDGTLYW